MSDRALSEPAMLASLRDIHLPSSAPGGLLADLCVAVGSAAFAALALAAILRLLSVRKPRAAAPSLRSELDAVWTLPETQKRVALLHVLREQAPDRYAEIRGALYEPGGGVDLETLEAEAARLV